METKTCTNCSTNLPIFDFYIKRAAKDGRTSQCITCTNYKYRKPLNVITTYDLIKQQFEGTISEKNNLLLARRIELENELNNPNLYKNYFKTKCVVKGCKRVLPSNTRRVWGRQLSRWEHYKAYGNYCFKCHKRIEQKSKKAKDPIITRIINTLLNGFER